MSLRKIEIDWDQLDTVMISNEQDSSFTCAIDRVREVQEMISLLPSDAAKDGIDSSCCVEEAIVEQGETGYTYDKQLAIQYSSNTRCVVEMKEQLTMPSCRVLN